jgi:hypothetical protein
MLSEVPQRVRPSRCSPKSLLIPRGERDNADVNRDQRLVAFIGALSLVVSACGSSPSAPTATGPFVVTGLVLDFQTNAAVPGATVSFGGLLSATVLPDDPRALTDGTGSYQLALMPGRYHAWVDSVYRGEALVWTGLNRTDLLVRDGGCAVRYGTIADATTGRPIAGAAVSLVGVMATSGSDGSYRLDFGCRGPFAFSGTIMMSVSRAGYRTRSLSAGRGENLINAIRQDVDLDPQ